MSRAVIVLERVEPGIQPDYCTHGRATCVACPEWVWLGSETFEIVESGQALPLCVQCAHRVLPAGARPAGQVVDHMRDDGPHDQ